MEPVKILTTAQGFRVHVSRRGIIGKSGLMVTGFSDKLKHVEFDRQVYKWTLRNEFFRYDEKSELCFFPKFELDRFKAYLEQNAVRYTVEALSPVEGAETPYYMLPHISYKNEKQKGAVEFLTNKTAGPVRGLALQTGEGKAQPLDSLVLTPDGWTKMEDVNLSTLAVLPNGKTAPVIGIYPQGVKDVYRITFEDGRTAECCDEHLWDVHYVQWKDKCRTLTLRDIRILLEANPTYKNRMYIQLPEPEYKEDAILPIDPYALGALIGDGSLGEKWVKFSTSDEFLIDQLNSTLPTSVRLKHIGGYDYRICRTDDAREQSGRRESNTVLNSLRVLGLSGTYSNTKFIPKIYFDASPTQKWSLLQGLMDTDGTVNVNGNCSYTTVSETLANQIQDLVRSLGGLAKVTSRIPSYTYKGEKKNGQLAYTVLIRVKDPSALFRLPRKKDKTPENYQYADRLKLRIKYVEYVGKKETQCIMIGHPDHLYITDNYVVTHNTVSYIWSVQKWSVRSMITMTSRLEQWARELGNYTTLDEDDVYLIQGVASLTKLFDRIDKDVKPKFILASSKTIRLYLDYGPGYQHLPPPHEMCEKLGIGIVGTDEYHEHFMTNFLIGITLNPALFIPITATFVASDPFVRNIFDQFVPKAIQFYGGEYNKFVNATSYQYTSGGHLIKPFHYMSPRGYSQQIFEKALLGRLRKVLDALVQDAFIPIIKEHYVDIAEPGEKFLFLCSSTKLCDHLVNIFTRAFPGKTVTAFYSGIPESVLKEYDIILSTPGSAGTGRDIKGLRTCFVFESVDSEARNLQFIGRLRGPPQMLNTPEFVYLSFSCIPQHQKYHTSRAMLFGARAKSFKHRAIS